MGILTHTEKKFQMCFSKECEKGKETLKTLDSSDLSILWLHAVVKYFYFNEIELI
jgi:hypothetical protein